MRTASSTATSSTCVGFVLKLLGEPPSEFSSTTSSCLSAVDGKQTQEQPNDNARQVRRQSGHTCACRLHVARRSVRFKAAPHLVAQPSTLQSRSSNSR